MEKKNYDPMFVDGIIVYMEKSRFYIKFYRFYKMLISEYNWWWNTLKSI